MLNTTYAERDRAAFDASRERAARMERAEEVAGLGYEVAPKLWAVVNTFGLRSIEDYSAFVDLLERAIEVQPLSVAEGEIYHAAALLRHNPHSMAAKAKLENAKLEYAEVGGE